MHRVSTSPLAALALSATLAATAAAGIHVRATVAPDTLAQCSNAHFSAALWNTGPDTLRVRVSISLTYRDSLPLGTLIGHTVLVSGEVRTREFDAPIPPRMPPGPYALLVRAVASDGSADQVAVRFTVTASDCPPPVVVNDPGLALMSGVSSGLSLEPDSATPTLHHSWGQLKVRYRR